MGIKMYLYIYMAATKVFDHAIKSHRPPVLFPWPSASVVSPTLGALPETGMIYFTGQTWVE